MADGPRPRQSLAGDLRAAAVILAAVTLLASASTLTLVAVAALIGVERGTAAPLTAEGVAAHAGPEWFHGRPSAMVGGVSGGSNLAATNPALASAVEARLAAVRAENPTHRGPVPVDLVTASASGLDPHLSPEAARLQVPRVAAANEVPEEAIAALVERSIEGRSLGLFGSPRVDVVRLNDALDAFRSVVDGMRERTTVSAPVER